MAAKLRDFNIMQDSKDLHFNSKLQYETISFHLTEWTFPVHLLVYDNFEVLGFVSVIEPLLTLQL